MDKTLNGLVVVPTVLIRLVAVAVVARFRLVSTPPVAKVSIKLMSVGFTTDENPLKTLKKLKNLLSWVPLGTSPLNTEWDSVRTLFRSAV